MGRAGVYWKDPRQGHPLRWSHHRGARALCFLLLLEERDLMGVGALLPSFGFKDFHHAARLQSPASGHLEG
jgi:hypothetical protein